MKLNTIRYLFKEGLKNIWNNRTMSIASIGVLLACLLLTGASILISMNISVVMESIQNNNSIMVYIKEDCPTLRAIQIGEQIKKLDNVESCEYIPKSEALDKIKDKLGVDGALLEALGGDDNPLPDTFKVSILNLSKYKTTAQKIKQIEGVSKVTDYSNMADKLTSLDNLVSVVSFWIILVLSLISLFIIANTVRMTMFSKRLEISIMKSVGATNWFIRIPCIVEGIVIGLFSGIISCILLAVVYNQTMVTVIGIATFIRPLPIDAMFGKMLLLFIGAGMLYGIVGSIISMGRYLRKEGGDSIVQ